MLSALPREQALIKAQATLPGSQDVQSKLEHAHKTEPSKSSALDVTLLDLERSLWQ